MAVINQDAVPSGSVGRAEERARVCDVRPAHGFLCESLSAYARPRRLRSVLDVVTSVLAYLAMSVAGYFALEVSPVLLMLPTDVMEVNADATTAAAAVVADLLTEAQEITAALDTAREEATNIIEQQRILDGKTRTRIDTPLAKLRADLDAWATAAAEAMTHLDAGGIPQLPEAPTESGLAEVRTFAAELTTASAAVDSLLGKAADGFRANAHTVATALKEYAAALDHVDDFDPSADLTAPHAVYPLVAAAARATQEAQDQRTAEQTALGQIRPAADLDFAIGTGQAPAV